MLERAQRPVLPEWLEALAAAGRRPPDSLLPALLDAAHADAALRRPVAAVAGPRGRWLAQLNPDWAFVAEGAAPRSPDEAALAELWQTGGRNGRLFLLESLRPARPELGRALVESTWASEKADDRAAFVAALAAGLGPADEPFLEAALDDRAKDVRATAARLLAQLPDSRLARQMAERALGLVRYSGGLFPKIEVSLPEACDKALQRDGVEPKPRQGLGERAWWLRQIVARTPPAAWSAAWRQTPQAILGLRVAKEWRGLLLEAWAEAAAGYGDLAWAQALAELAMREAEAAPALNLLPLLPRERREALLIKLLSSSRKPFGREHPALGPLRASPAPWGAALAAAVIEALARRLNPLKDDASTDWHLRAALGEFALAIPPELAEEAIAVLPEELGATSFWGDEVRGFVERLRLRRDMYAALRSGA
jgi:hypothetical protein